MTKFYLWLTAVAVCALLGGQIAHAEDSGGLRPMSEDVWDYAKARHLLARAGFGGTPAEVEKLHAMGLRKAVDFLVDYQQQPAADFPLALDPPRPVKKTKLDRKALAKLSPKDRRKALQQQKKQQNTKRRKNDRQQFGTLRQWWMRRLVESPRPLEEKLVLFWHGHFATGYRTVKDTYAMYLQNDKQANYTALAAAAQSMGQELLEPPNVKGWDGGSAWINTNTMFARNNFATPLPYWKNGSGVRASRF